MYKLFVWKGIVGLPSYSLPFFELDGAIKYARILAKENRLRKVNKKYIWYRVGNTPADAGVVSSLAIDNAGGR